MAELVDEVTDIAGTTTEVRRYIKSWENPTPEQVRQARQTLRTIATAAGVPEWGQFLAKVLLVLTDPIEATPVAEVTEPVPDA
jgi:hypothetical protein